MRCSHPPRRRNRGHRQNQCQHQSRSRRARGYETARHKARLPPGRRLARTAQVAQRNRQVGPRSPRRAGWSRSERKLNRQRQSTMGARYLPINSTKSCGRPRARARAGSAALQPSIKTMHSLPGELKQARFQAVVRDSRTPTNLPLSSTTGSSLRSVLLNSQLRSLLYSTRLERV